MSLIDAPNYTLVFKELTGYRGCFNTICLSAPDKINLRPV